MQATIQSRLTNIAIPTSFDASLCDSYSLIGRQPMATPPLHLPIFSGVLPPISGSLHLPNMQQSLLKAVQPTNPLSLAYGREAIQVSPSRLRQSVQRTQQHEASRARMSQFRRRRSGLSATHPMQATTRTTISNGDPRVLMYKVQYFLSLSVLLLERLCRLVISYLVPVCSPHA